MTDKDMKLVPVGTEPLPEAYSDLSWGWFVLPEGDGSRLILRTQASDEGLGGFASWINDKPLEMGGAVFGMKTLRGIKRTAENLHEAGVRVDENGRQIAGPTEGL